MRRDPHQDPTNSPWWFRIAGKPWSPITLLALVFLLVVVYQIFSPLTLVEDEAHYWEWSRRLDWSYYSKGPGVALLIRASTSIFSTSESAIRLPAAVSILLMGIAIVRTTKDFFEDRVCTFISAILALAIPGFIFSSFLMTIDAPYLACWAWACYFAARAITRARPSDWARLGLVLALGFLMKYTIVLLLPGVLLAILLTRSMRPPIKPLSAILGTSLVLLGLIPVLIWNADHDWATVRHLLGHLALPGGDTHAAGAITPSKPYSITWTLEYLGILLLMGGSTIALAAYAHIGAKDQRARTASIILIALALPVLVFYLLVSFQTRIEGNWAMSGLVSLVPLAALGTKRALNANNHFMRFMWGAACVAAVATHAFFPLAPYLSTRPIIGPLIPIHRATGMREHASIVQSSLDTLARETNQTPFLMVDHYGRASQLAYYLPDHPTVYSNAALVGGRKTQHDLWAHTNLANPDTLAQLADRPAILVGGTERMWSFAFATVTPIEPFAHSSTPDPDHTPKLFAATSFSNFDLWTPLMPDVQPDED